MQIQDKIELIKVLLGKLKMSDSMEIRRSIDNCLEDPRIVEKDLDEILVKLKSDAVEQARLEFETAERKKRTKQQIKTWCKHNNIDYDSLRYKI